MSHQLCFFSENTKRLKIFELKLSPAKILLHLPRAFKAQKAKTLLALLHQICIPVEDFESNKSHGLVSSYQILIYDKPKLSTSPTCKAIVTNVRVVTARRPPIHLGLLFVESRGLTTGMTCTITEKPNTPIAKM